MDKRLLKWHSWFQVISDEVRALVTDSDVYWKVQQMIRENPKIDVPNPFYGFLSSAYASHAVSGIRRLVKPQSDSISFVGLLREIESTPEVLSRDYFRSLYGERAKFLAERAFESHHGKLDHFEPAIATQDLAQLKIISEHIEDFSDRRVAHRDKRSPKRLPTYKDVRDCVATIDSLCVKYHLLIHGENVMGNSMLGLAPWTWLKIFRTPWIAPNQEEP